MIAGLVLAGGRSSRFGREKAVVDLEGELLIARVLRVLVDGCTQVAISAPPGSGAADFAAAQALTCLADATSDTAGPLSGIRAGLSWARSQGCDWLAIAPCDTPLLPHDMVQRLYAARSAGGAVVSTSEGPHPLCALWPTRALEIIVAVPGHPPVRDLLHRLGAAEVTFAETAAFANLNTPEDHAQATRYTATRRPG